MKLASRGRVTSYLDATSLAGSFAVSIGSIVGERVHDDRFTVPLNLEGSAEVFSVPAFPIQGMDVAFVLAFGIGLYSIHRRSLVVEEGEIERGIVVQNLFTEIKLPLLSFMTVKGFSEIASSPYSALRQRRREHQRRSTMDEERTGEASTK